MAVDKDSATTAVPASRRYPTLVALALYVVAASALAIALAALIALAKSLPAALFGGGVLTSSFLSDSLETHLVGTLSLLPLTLVGVVVAGIVSRTEDFSPHTGMIVVTLGAAVGGIAATQLMAPAGIASHDLAAWAVLAPAAALLLAIAPWPGALVHPDGGQQTALERAEAHERAAADSA